MHCCKKSFSPKAATKLVIADVRLRPPYRGRLLQIPPLFFQRHIPRSTTTVLDAEHGLPTHASQACLSSHAAGDLLPAAKITTKNAFVPGKPQIPSIGGCNLVAYPRIISYVHPCESNASAYCYLDSQRVLFAREWSLSSSKLRSASIPRTRDSSALLTQESPEDVRGVTWRCNRSVLKHIVITNRSSYKSAQNAPVRLCAWVSQGGSSG